MTPTRLSLLVALAIGTGAVAGACAATLVAVVRPARERGEG